MSYGGELIANQLMTTLMAGENLPAIPDINFDDPIYQIPGSVTDDMYKVAKRLTNDDLTTGDVSGTGTFDAVMRGMKAHLTVEYEKGRITGAEYTKAYISMVESALSNSVQFLLGRDSAFWQAVAAQTQAITARVAMETGKLQYAAMRIEALTQRANYALTKLKLANEDAQYGQLKFTVDQLMPLQREGLVLNNETATYQLEQILPTQKAGMLIQNSTGQFQLSSILPTQKAGMLIQNDTGMFQLNSMLPQQLKLLLEQTEVQRAQTLNARTDGAVVVGLLGKQKDLYTQQITSYQRDAEVKAAKLFTDAWITMKTIDEGLVPPGQYANSNLDQILSTLKTKNGI